MRRFLRLLLQYQMRSSPSPINPQEKGMTMIELLVGTIIAFIILTPLMGMVIGLLNDDQKEGAKATTEQEIQSALDYISEDISQALYIYDPQKVETTAAGTTTTDELNQLKTANFLPTTGTPVLVFWKRKMIENAVPVNLTKTPLPKDCDESQPDKKCNDTYVLSLVSYHLLSDTNPTWCQPQGTKCPSRIIRYEISDWLKKTDGTAYTEAELGLNLKSYAKTNLDNLPFNPLFSLDKPLINVTDTAQIANARSQVLVNYIEDFKLDNASTNNLAKINMTANSARRIESNATSCINKSSPYCLQSSVQVRGLSNLGASE